MSRLKQLSNVWPGLQNRYVITGIAGLMWVSFVSDIDLIYLIKSQRQLSQLQHQVRHLEGAIQTIEQRLEDLSSNPERLEKFAREQYFMKRDNEDVFRIINGFKTADT